MTIYNASFFISSHRAMTCCYSCLSIIRISNLEILTQYPHLSQCLSIDAMAPSNSFLLHAVCSCMASIVILYCIIIRRAAEIWKLQPKLKFPTDIPLSWRNDLGSVALFCDIFADIEASFDLSDVSEFMSLILLILLSKYWSLQRLGVCIVPVS